MAATQTATLLFALLFVLLHNIRFLKSVFSDRGVKIIFSKGGGPAAFLIFLFNTDAAVAAVVDVAAVRADLS